MAIITLISSHHMVGWLRCGRMASTTWRRHATMIKSRGYPRLRCMAVVTLGSRLNMVKLFSFGNDVVVTVTAKISNRNMAKMRRHPADSAMTFIALGARLNVACRFIIIMALGT